MPEFAESIPAFEQVHKLKRRRKILVFCVISVLNVGLLVLILIQLLTPASHSASVSLLGQPAPDFSLAALASQIQQGESSLALANFKGKPVILNFWASWCDPCKQETPMLENTWKQFQAQGKDLVILGIDFEETQNDGASFLQRYGITYPVGLDIHGSVAAKYNITSLPDTIFINRNGIVVGKELQQLTAQTLASNLKLIV
ncbi:MAG TPA: TlpA disulfide reductase family protein [Ktedonobacteraceae bacterium]